jgi:Protein of unknown function (DUF3969)
MDEQERNRLERLVALLSLGACAAVKGNLISLDEAERLVFSPGTMRVLRLAGARDAAITTIHTGTELNDVRRLVPDHLAAALEGLEHEAAIVLASSEPTSPDLGNWLERILV